MFKLCSNINITPAENSASGVGTGGKLPTTGTPTAGATYSIGEGEEANGQTQVSFDSINDVVIKRGISQLGATATLKIPLNSVLKKLDGSKSRTKTSNEIRTGDRIVIKLGYNGVTNTEFTGYVTEVDERKMVTLTCEDEYYMCRKRNVIVQGSADKKGAMTISEILTACQLTNNRIEEDFTVKNFTISNKPVSTVLSTLKDKYGLSIFFDMEGVLCVQNGESKPQGLAQHRTLDPEG